MLNPDRVRSQLEGAAIFATSLAFYGEITAKEGVIEQSNFHDYQMTRMNQIPKIHTYLIKSDATPTGIGEPGYVMQSLQRQGSASVGCHLKN